METPIKINDSREPPFQETSIWKEDLGQQKHTPFVTIFPPLLHLLCCSQPWLQQKQLDKKTSKSVWCLPLIIQKLNIFPDFPQKLYIEIYIYIIVYLIYHWYLPSISLVSENPIAPRPTQAAPLPQSPPALRGTYVRGAEGPNRKPCWILAIWGYLIGDLLLWIHLIFSDIFFGTQPNICKDSKMKSGWKVTWNAWMDQNWLPQSPKNGPTSEVLR